MKIDPQEIKGIWTHGWALDLHTLSSEYIGDNVWGHPMFKNTRSEIGEAINRLKYKGDKSQVDPIVQIMADYIRSKRELDNVSIIIATPPSDMTRSFQPVQAITEGISAMLGIPAPTDYLQKIKPTPALKNMDDTQERHAELQGAFKVIDERYKDYHVLILDDIFRSGETLNAICDALISQGKVGKISVVTATITRSKK